jgi:pimeloyl-ACP methyl ester carboxylesterase
VLVPGAWSHRDVSANGTRLHVAECGSGPLVLLVHGFPEFWWSWRHQLSALARAGYRAVACDLRGYGASDKPPRGYDVFTGSADLSGLIRALGERSAVVVGQDFGGYLAWATAVLHPDVVAGLVVAGAPHPLRMRQAIVGSRSGQARASSYLLGFQVPWRPERELVKDDAALVGDLMRRWGGPGFPDQEVEERAREAMQIPGVPHCSMEYYRWIFRSMFRPDGWRMLRAMQAVVNAPTLQLQGELDRCVLPSSAQGSDAYVAAPYEWRLLPGVGHFPAQEAAQAFNHALIEWLDRLPA